MHWYLSQPSPFWVLVLNTLSRYLQRWLCINPCQRSTSLCEAANLTVLVLTAALLVRAKPCPPFRHHLHFTCIESWIGVVYNYSCDQGSHFSSLSLSESKPTAVCHNARSYQSLKSTYAANPDVRLTDASDGAGDGNGCSASANGLRLLMCKSIGHLLRLSPSPSPPLLPCNSESTPSRPNTGGGLSSSHGGISRVPRRSLRKEGRSPCVMSVGREICLLPFSGRLRLGEVVVGEEEE